MKKIISNFSGVIFLSLLAQIFGMLRSILLANELGTSQAVDAFYLSNVFTINIFNIFSSAIITVVIPEVTKLKNKQDRVGLEVYFTFLSILTVIISFFMWLIFKNSLDIVVPSFDYEYKKIFFISFTFLLIGQLFRIQTAFSTGVLQSGGKFILPKIGVLISTALPIVYLTLTNSIDIKLLALATTLGYAIESIVVLFFQSKVMKFKFRFKPFKKDAVLLFKNTVPIIISSSVFQIQIAFSNYMMGRYGEGYVSIYSNTNQIVGIFQLLFISNIISIVYPKITREINNNIKSGLSNLTNYINITNALVILFVWGYIILGKDLISLIFVRGAFTPTDANEVYKFGAILVLSLPISVARDYIYRFFYAIDRVNIPSRNAVLTVSMNVVIILVLHNFIGVYSVMAATLFGSIFSLSMIVGKMKKSGFSMKYKKIIRSFIFCNVNGVVMSFILNNIKITNFNIVVNFLFNVLIAISLYCIPLLFIVIYKRKKV